MQRFVDRRTSTLLRSLRHQAGALMHGVNADGTVTVEGHVVGRISGVHFEPERGASALEDRALRGAVERAVAPEVARRLGELASESDEVFALQAGWNRVLARACDRPDRRRRALQAARAAHRRSRRRRSPGAGGAAARSLRRGRGEPPPRAASRGSSKRSRPAGCAAWRAASPISSSNNPACSTAAAPMSTSAR